jgi:hypothetical protein
MEDHLGRPRSRWLLTSWVLAASLIGVIARAEAPGSPARAGLALAAAAATAWAPDAELVYVENDEPLDASGRSLRWGYLFRSATLGRARVWSVRDGRIVTAENLELRFDAPPLPAGWLDSDAVLAAAEKAAAPAARREARGKLATMLLMRGAESGFDRDATTWTFVYGASGGAAFHVVVDAATGQVKRTWRG